MNIEAALREWEAQCWEQYNHENDYINHENDYIEPQESEVKENDKRRNQHLF